MTILASECLGWISGTIGDDTEDSGMTILNAAGVALIGLHQWRWLETEATVDLVADQDYALLPGDLRTLLAIHGADGTNRSDPATIEYLVRLKSTSDEGGSFYKMVVTYRTISNVPVPVLRIHPSPSASETGAFDIAYLRGWTDVCGDDDPIIIPPWIKPLYRQVVVAYARGYDEDDEARALPMGQAIDEQLASIKMGMTFRMAQQRDGSVNPTYARVRNGWIQTNNRVYGGNVGNSRWLRNGVDAV